MGIVDNVDLTEGIMISDEVSEATGKLDDKKKKTCTDLISSLQNIWIAAAD